MSEYPLCPSRERDEEWGTGGNTGGGSSEPKDYEGPAGMDVDGVIESTYTEVSSAGRFSCLYQIPLECSLIILDNIFF